MDRVEPQPPAEDLAGAGWMSGWSAAHTEWCDGLHPAGTKTCGRVIGAAGPITVHLSGEPGGELQVVVGAIELTGVDARELRRRLSEALQSGRVHLLEDTRPHMPDAT